MNRRALWGFLAVSPVAAAGAALAAVDSKYAPREDDFGISIVPNKIEPRPPTQGCIISLSMRADESRRLDIKVGEDGHLWVKRAASQRWERVVTA